MKRNNRPRPPTDAEKLEQLAKIIKLQNEALDILLNGVNLTHSAVMIKLESISTDISKIVPKTP